jgi:uncharacterized membrane protein
MKLLIVGNRDGTREIVWGGLMATGLIVTTLSVVGYLAARLVLPVPLFPGVIFAATIPVGAVLGVQLRTAWKLPLDQLPPL